MKLIDADELMTTLEKERQNSVSYEQWALAHVISLVDKMPGVELTKLADYERQVMDDAFVNKLP